MCGPPSPGDYKQPSRKRFGKVDRGDKLIAEGRLISKEKDLEALQYWYYVLQHSIATYGLHNALVSISQRIKSCAVSFEEGREIHSVSL